MLPSSACSLRAYVSLALLAAAPAFLPSAALASGHNHIVAYRVKRAIALPGYTAVRPVAFDAADEIAGDADRDGTRHCLLYRGGTLVDISPAGWTSCSVAGMNESGTVVGQVQKTGAAAGFVYRGGQAIVLTDAAAFTYVDGSSLLLGLTKEGLIGTYDVQGGRWLKFADAKSGCSVDVPLAIDERYVFGRGSCGSPSYVLASNDGVVRASLPDGMSPTQLFTSHDQLLLLDEAGHVHEWSPLTNHMQDLGTASGEPYGVYSPVAVNGAGVVVGTNA